jgi:mannitol-1-phosphate 5-dehydrogenase
MKILHFGAGSIGRGLIYPFFRGSHDITLVDRNVDLIRAIKDNHGYRVIERDYGRQSIRTFVDPPIVSYAELSSIQDVDVITTSVIVKNLVQIAPYIREIAKNNKRPLYIIPMENSPEAVSILRSEITSNLTDSDDIYFLGSVIDRIVPGIKNVLDVECESYLSIKIENRHHIGSLLKDDAVLADNIGQEFDKKFLLVNGLHACAAYLGYPRGHAYICDVMKDAAIRQKLELVGECYIQYLGSHYEFSAAALASYCNKSLDRFANPSLKDPLSRVGRNLLLKLSADERICRPLLFNKGKGLSYKPLEEVVDAAQHFTIANDYEDYVRYLEKKRL